MKHLTKEHAVAPINLRIGFSIHLLIFLVTVPVLWSVWFLTDATYPWPAWNTGAWAIGILFHFLGVYVFRKNKSTK